MEYQSAVKLLEGFWEKSLEQLPPAQASAWNQATLPGLAWDNLSPEERQSVAAQHDQQHDPANAEENEFWFKNACEINDAEGHIREIELMAASIPSELEAKNRLMAETRTRLLRLKSVQFVPSTVGDSRLPIACHSAYTKQEIIDGFNLDGKKWDEILSRPGSDGKRYKDALVQPGKRGRGKNGKSNSALWNPVVFARLLIQHKDMTQGLVVARLKKAWPNLEDEMMVEIGEIER